MQNLTSYAKFVSKFWENHNYNSNFCQKQENLMKNK